MNPSDIPPTALVRSALEAFSKADVEATVLYTVEKNGKRITRADSNGGPVLMARQLAAVRISDGAFERAAIGLHEFRLKLPDDIDAETRAEMDKCPVCGETGAWNDMSEPDRDGHRALAKVVIAHALSAPPATGPMVVT